MKVRSLTCLEVVETDRGREYIDRTEIPETSGRLVKVLISGFMALFL